MSERASKLHLNIEDRRLLGVCSGFADYLDVPPALVRVIFVIACFTWPSLIVAYFVAYWFMKTSHSETSSDGVFSRTRTAGHFRDLNYRKKIYRDPSDTRIAGVCSGVAHYLDISPCWVRVMTAGSFFVFGPFTVIGYIVCWFVLEKAPKGYYSGAAASAENADSRDRHSDSQRASSPGRSSYSVEQCAETYRELENRLRDIEAYMTSSKFSLHCEINRI